MTHKKVSAKTQKDFWGGAFETKSGETVEIPEWISLVDMNTIKVRTSDWSGSRVTVIHRKKSAGYEGQQGSGYATFAGIGGDWRQMQGLAEEVNFIFSKMKEMK